MITFSDIISLIELATTIRENARRVNKKEIEVLGKRSSYLFPYIDSISDSLTNLCLQIQEAPCLIEDGNAGLAMRNLLKETRKTCEIIGKHSWRFPLEQDNLLSELFSSLKKGEAFLNEYDGDISADSFFERVLTSCYGEDFINQSSLLLSDFRDIINS